MILTALCLRKDLWLHLQDRSATLRCQLLNRLGFGISLAFPGAEPDKDRDLIPLFARILALSCWNSRNILWCKTSNIVQSGIFSVISDLDRSEKWKSCWSSCPWFSNSISSIGPFGYVLNRIPRNVLSIFADCACSNLGVTLGSNCV